jgi:hypothetical protein
MNSWCSAAKGIFQLGLDSGDLGNPAAGRLTSAVVHERGLADSRLSAHDQNRALTLTDAVEHAVERLPLPYPPSECRRPSWCGHVVNDTTRSLGPH